MVCVSFALLTPSLTAQVVSLAKITVLNPIKFGTDSDVFAPKVFICLEIPVSHVPLGQNGTDPDACLKLSLIAKTDKFSSMDNVSMWPIESKPFYF